MNIFYLDGNARLAAEAHCDKHVVKMVLETAQLLSTAHRVLDGDEYADSVGLYKATHKNHPSAVWARNGQENYCWLHDLFNHLCFEYHKRYNKAHKTSKLMYPLSRIPTYIPLVSFCPPPQCMPDEYKVDNDTVLAYRKYYLGAKKHFAKWTKTQAPSWWVNNDGQTTTSERD